MIYLYLVGKTKIHCRGRHGWTGFLQGVNSLKCTSSVCARKTGISGKIALSLDTNVSAGLVQVGLENVLTLLRVKQSTQPHLNGNITDGATNAIISGGGKC